MPLDRKRGGVGAKPASKVRPNKRLLYGAHSSPWGTNRLLKAKPFRYDEWPEVPRKGE